MPILELNEVRDAILARAKEASCPLEGPAETAYGIGWIPSTSFWFGKRRIHFYVDRSEEEWDDVWGVAEIAESSSAKDGPVWETRFRTVDEAWELTRRYLVDQSPLPITPSDQWKLLTKGSHDRHIPIPPNNYHPGNFGPWVAEANKVSSKQPLKEFTLDDAIQQPSAIALVRVLKPPDVRRPGVDTPLGCLGALLWSWFRRRDGVDVQTIEQFKGVVPEVFRFRLYDHSFSILSEDREFQSGGKTLVFLDWDQGEQKFYLRSQMPLTERNSKAFVETFIRSSTFWKGFESVRE